MNISMEFMNEGPGASEHVCADKKGRHALVITLAVFILLAFTVVCFASVDFSGAGQTKKTTNSHEKTAVSVPGENHPAIDRSVKARRLPSLHDLTPAQKKKLAEKRRNLAKILLLVASEARSG
ncbi:MAG: hypothetical protein KAJ60_06860 [Desulfobulbaceae bacterium]|nr:hypothetical protein [Desulfobulbaceae bacterium]